MKVISSIILVFIFIGCRSLEPRRPITHQSGNFIEASIQRNKALQKKEEEQIQQIITRDSTHKYFSSENAFWYRIDQKSSQKSSVTPETGDLVQFHYDVSTLSGKPIYSEKEIGTQDYLVDKEDLMPGLRLALKLMRTGETATFLFPSFMGYGYYGDQDKIGRNTPLKVTLTLDKINRHYDKKIN